MNSTVLLLFTTELVGIVLVTFFTKRNFISPGFCSLVMFAVATICIIYNNDFWDVSYQYSTYLFLVIGFGAMLLPELFFLFVYNVSNSWRKNVDRIDNDNNERFMRIFPRSGINALLYLMATVFFLLIISEVVLRGDFKELGLYAIGVAKADESKYSVFSRFGISYLNGLNIAYLCFFLNNIIRMKENWNSNLKLLYPSFLYIVCMLLLGNRVFLLKTFGAVFVFWFVMKWDVSKKGKVSFFKTARNVLLSATVILLAFYMLRGITKVNSTAATRNFTDYITYYVGSPLYLFDKYLAKYTPDGRWGARSLTSLLQMFGIDPDYINSYILVGGASNFAGNEFSWFQRPYSDFGFLGTILFTVIVYSFFDWLVYCKVLKRNYKNRDLWMIVLAYYFYIPLMSFYYCQVCFAISLSNLTSIVLACCIYSVIKNGKVRIVFGRLWGSQ